MDIRSIQFHCNSRKAVENTGYLFSPADFHHFHCQLLILLRLHIFFPQKNPPRMRFRYFFYSFQERLPREFSICHTNNIRHIDNHSEPAAGLLLQCLHTFFRSFFHLRFQTARRPDRLLFPFLYICFRDPRFRLKLRQKPW